MPAKKTKTTAKKKKTSTKKKAVSRAKKTPVKKKTNAKKKSTKSRSKKTASRKKSVAQTKKNEVRSPFDLPKEEPKAQFAKSIHNKHAHLSFTSAKKTLLSKQELRAKFSFPQALSQVRDKVDSDDAHIPQLAEQEVKHLKLDAEHSSHAVSPYVLDLKQRTTVVHSHRVSPQAQKKMVQPALGLFEEEPASVVDSLHEFADSLVSHFAPKKRLNLLQVQKLSRPNLLKRISFALSRQIDSLGEQLSSPLRSYQAKKNQKVLALPKASGASDFLRAAKKQKKIPLFVASHKSKEIKVEQVSTTIDKSKHVLADASNMLQLSEFMGKKRTFSAAEIFSGLSFSKAFVPFATLCFVLLIPFAGAELYESLTKTQGEVFGAADKAVNQLQQATEQIQSFQFIEASQTFDSASQTFLAASAIIENQQGGIADVLSFLPVVGTKIEAGEDILEIGNQLSESAALLSQGVAVLSDPDHFLVNEPLSTKLEYLFVRLEEAEPYLVDSAEQLAQIDSEILPEDVRSEIESMQKTLPVLTEQLSRVNDLSPMLLSYLGHESLQRYLVVFQNNTELRPTGGFMGSMALIDLDRAEIQAIDIPGGGPYDYQGSYFEQVAAPGALQLINARWELQDANWFYDWPTSAQKVSSVYEKAGGPSVDGVVALNTNVLEALLEFIGPIYLEQYDREFTADDFRSTLQTYVEFEYDKDLNQPKQIIADLAPLLLEEVKNLPPKDYLILASELSTLLQEKDIMIYHNDDNIQAEFTQLGWSGEVLETDKDYLAIVHTNLAGGKTDGLIDDTYDLSTHISENGDVEHTLEITRTHNGPKGVPLIGVRNVDYLRIYVPQGSELVSATGFEQPPRALFDAPLENAIEDPLLLGERNAVVDADSLTEIYNEGTKQVFANWVQVDPGESVTVKVVYTVPASAITVFELPERESSWTDWLTGKTAQKSQSLYGYQLVWQKQSGAWSPEMNMNVTYPYHWQIQAASDASGTSSAGQWTASAEMNSDSVWSFLFF